MVDRILAVVNEDIILLSELDEIYQPLAVQIKSNGYTPEKERNQLYHIREQLINKLVEDKLTKQEVEANNLTVNGSEIDNTIERVKQANYLSDEEFRKALELSGKDIEAYREQIKEEILRTKLVNLEVNSKIVITKADIKSYYKTHPELYQGETKYHLRNIFLNNSEKPDTKESLNRRF
ncbi:MAG: SurA N-terminal domain-containing protein, partial [Desulfobacteraceae bacterium]